MEINKAERLKKLLSLKVRMIIIHYDFTDGTEVSYAEGKMKGDDFTTCCLDFFTSDKNAIVLKGNGEWVSTSSLLNNDGLHTEKMIRPQHNLHKMLAAGAFTFAPPSAELKCADYGANINRDEPKAEYDEIAAFEYYGNAFIEFGTALKNKGTTISELAILANRCNLSLNIEID